MTNTEQKTPKATTTGNTPLSQILLRMFPKGMIKSQQEGTTVNSCLLNGGFDVHVLLWKTKSIPVDGNMLATVSTLDTAGRNRWFLMECGEVYVVIRMSPSKNSGNTHLAVVHCVGAAVTERDKFEWRQCFPNRVAEINSSSLGKISD